MPVPKRKLSRKRRDQRSANKGIKPKSISGCQTCQAPTMPHQVCGDCGYYKGVKVLRTKTDRMYARGQVRDARHEKMRAMQPTEQSGDSQAGEQ